ncbi:SnoaL-like protein [Paraburkholderia silvatlantica]|uniref:SnoaL-like protein n=1 Tax=Paraburkholderia silvatlantica TaxID=321895 RepID=A0A2V4T3T5_9BURK|nr:nuclear transport factor 2 family protein [Paraburkholderia silvatlantica]PYE18388.1 SnoaL-like protein [Paraburkholderia silvatlantica]
MPNQDTLEQISDRQHIADLLYRSLRCTDEKHIDELQNCYTEELVIDFGEVKPPQQLAAKDLAAWARRAYALVKTQHMMFNVEITLDGDHASSLSCGHALHQRTDTGDFWHIYPRYEFGYSRTENGWRISRIKMTPVFEEGNPALLDEAWAATPTGSDTQ